jgi:hypothetical protein
VAPSKNNAKLKSRADLIATVTTPISFYVLALLIVEGTLAIVLSCSKLSEEHVWEGFKWMIGVLGGVVLIVTVLVISNPRNLLYGKEEHRDPALDPSALQDDIEDRIAANVKPECLINPPKSLKQGYELATDSDRSGGDQGVYRAGWSSIHLANNWRHRAANRIVRIEGRPNTRQIQFDAHSTGRDALGFGLSARWADRQGRCVNLFRCSASRPRTGYSRI